MKKYIIDGNKFSTYEGAYIEIKNILSEGKENEVITISNMVKKYIKDNNEYMVIWNNHTKSKEDLSYNETIKFLKWQLQNVPLHEVVPVLKELKAAEANEGATMFDKIIKAFKDNNVDIILE